MPFGLIDPDKDTFPSYRQIIITDHTHAIVGAVDLLSGEFVKRNEQMLCTISADIDIADAPFYTLTVEGKYKLTVSRDALEANNWVHEMVMGSN
jgi:hypothetical protein